MNAVWISHAGKLPQVWLLCYLVTLLPWCLVTCIPVQLLLTIMAARRLPALLLPGQGNQQRAMLQPYLARFPSIVKPILEEADESLKQRFSRILIDSTEADSMIPDINLTSNAQPAILTTSYAIFQILKSQLSTGSTGSNRGPSNNDTFLKSHFSHIMGHSLGEFSAATIAGHLQFADSVNLVHQRGKAMEESRRRFLEKQKAKSGKDIDLGMYVVPFPPNHASLVIKLFDTEIRPPPPAPETVQDLSRPDHLLDPSADIHPLVSFVELGNINSTSQIVFSGPTEAIDAVLEYIKKRLSLKRSLKKIPLQVSAPFHSPVMAHAQNKMQELVLELDEKNKIFFPTGNDADVSFVANITAKPFQNKQEFVRSLVWSCTDRVYWSKSIQYLTETAGVKKLVALAPGNVANFTKREVPKDVENVVVDDSTLAQVLETL